jgi:hypothetical protein
MLLQTTMPLQRGPVPRILTKATGVFSGHKSYCCIGTTEIAEEFIHPTSARARREATEWKPPHKSNPADYDILGTIRFVELTMRYPLTVSGARLMLCKWTKTAASVAWSSSTMIPPLSLSENRPCFQRPKTGLMMGPGHSKDYGPGEESVFGFSV